MNYENITVNRLEEAIDDKYVWPGGYAIYFICNDGEVLCHDCVVKNKELIIESINDHDNNGWRIIGIDNTNNDDEISRCAHCNKDIN